MRLFIQKMGSHPYNTHTCITGEVSLTLALIFPISLSPSLRHVLSIKLSFADPVCMSFFTLPLITGSVNTFHVYMTGNYKAQSQICHNKLQNCNCIANVFIMYYKEIREKDNIWLRISHVCIICLCIIMCSSRAKLTKDYRLFFLTCTLRLHSLTGFALQVGKNEKKN